MGATNSSSTAQSGRWGSWLLAPFMGPVARLKNLLDDPVRGKQQAEVLKAAQRCFLAGSFATVIVSLGRRDSTRPVIVQVLRHALAGDWCPLDEARELLMKPCENTGLNILHFLGRPSLDPELFIELLDFLRGTDGTLDALMTAGRRGNHPVGFNEWHPLYLAMSRDGDRGALELMRRVSPQFLWSPYISGLEESSTTLHAACSCSHFTAEERLEIIGRIPLEVLASVLGPHGRTPILHAAACGAGDWVDSLLDCLPPEALTVSDDQNCTLVHLMAYLPADSTRERILGLVPDVEHLCGEVATGFRRKPGCKGNAVMFHMAMGCDSFVPTLVSLTSDESLFASQWIESHAVELQVSLLHFAAARADLKVCETLLQRATAHHRNALLQKDTFGMTPLHALFEHSPMGYAPSELASCLSSIVEISSLFLEILTDDELQVKDNKGFSVLEKSLFMLTRVQSPDPDTRLFDICQELVDRTSEQFWPGSWPLLSQVFRITQRTLIHCEGRLRLIKSLLSRATIDDFYKDSSLYVNMMRRYPDVEAARLVLDATPRDAIQHFSKQIGGHCKMLCVKAATEPPFMDALCLLLEYIPPCILLTPISRVSPAPFVTAICTGNVELVAAMLAVCPEARTADFILEEGTLTALGLAQRRGQPGVASLLQPHAKSAAMH